MRPHHAASVLTSLLSTNSTRETSKAPVFAFPELSVERIFVFNCLVEKLLPTQKHSLFFSSPKDAVSFGDRIPGTSKMCFNHR